MNQLIDLWILSLVRRAHVAWGTQPGRDSAPHRIAFMALITQVTNILNDSATWPEYQNPVKFPNPYHLTAEEIGAAFGARPNVQNLYRYTVEEIKAAAFQGFSMTAPRDVRAGELVFRLPPGLPPKGEDER